MEFINKHYEKLILMAMLLFFVFAMVNVLSIASKTGEVTDADLRIPTKRPDHEVLARESDEFNTAKIWDSTRLNWLKADFRDKNSELIFYSDLVEIPGLASCLVGKDDAGKESGCGLLIPKVYFTGKKCPNCGRELKTPPDRPKIRRNVITADDSDGDGMPNNYEQTNNLNPADPYDAQYDRDGDGFSNVFEMEQNTSPVNPRNHPPLWYRLRLVAVRRIVLPITFRELNTNKQEDPRRWDIQFNVQVTQRNGKTVERTLMSRLNGTVEIEKRRYRIVKIERKLSDSTGAGRKPQKLVAGGTVVQEEEKAQDLSMIYLEEELTAARKKEGAAPDHLEMQIRKPVYSSDRRPIFEDVGKPEGERKEIVVRIGEKFRMGEYATGYAEYVLRKFDEKKMLAYLENTRVRGKVDPAKDENGKDMIVTRNSEIPEDCRVIKQISFSGGEESLQPGNVSRSDVGGRTRR